jgi:ribosomal protein S18 acetylase RimI-like enzyme
MDPAVLRLALAEHGASGADYTSNTLVRTYPDGLDVEVCSTEALAAADREASDPPEREHVTPFIYRRPERFCLRAFRSERLANRERWTVDSPEDLDVVHRLLELADWRSVGWEELLDGLGERLIAHDESLRLRPAGRADRDGLLALRNEQLTVRFSKSGREVAADEHDRWFSAVLTCPRTRVWIGEVDGHTVGEVRIDVTTGEADVDLAVDPMYRGHGYGRQLIAQLLETLRADYQVVTLRASVHTDNVASRRSFEANGFLLAESRRPDFLSLELAR